MKSCNAQYNKNKNTITFDCESSELVPGYLHYLLIFHHLPENATMIFKNESVRLVKKDQKYRFERI